MSGTGGGAGGFRAAAGPGPMASWHFGARLGSSSQDAGMMTTVLAAAPPAAASDPDQRGWSLTEPAIKPLSSRRHRISAARRRELAGSGQPRAFHVAMRAPRRAGPRRFPNLSRLAQDHAYGLFSFPRSWKVWRYPGSGSMLGRHPGQRPTRISPPKYTGQHLAFVMRRRLSCSPRPEESCMHDLRARRRGSPQPLARGPEHSASREVNELSIPATTLPEPRVVLPLPLSFFF